MNAFTFPLIFPAGLIVGAFASKLLTVAFFTLIVYEYAITMDDEVTHFWKGPFSVSQGLFFFNRYFPILCNFISFLCQVLDSPSDEAGFGKHILGCSALAPQDYWKNYLPSLVLHTVLYGLTVHQALVGPRNSKTAGIRKKLVTDGGVFYLIVLGSVALTSIGSILTKVPQISVPTIFSPIILTTTSIATSRIMISLRKIITNDEENLEWINTTNGPAMPISDSSDQLPRMSLFKRTPNALTGAQVRPVSRWSQAQLIVTPRPTLKLNTDATTMQINDTMEVFEKLNAISALDRYYGVHSPGELAQARYGSIYDEEKGLDDAYRRVLRTGRVFF